MISILNIFFYHPVSEATPNSKITGAYCVACGPVRQPYSYSVPSTHRMFKNSSTEQNGICSLRNVRIMGVQRKRMLGPGKQVLYLHYTTIVGKEYKKYISYCFYIAAKCITNRTCPVLLLWISSKTGTESRIHERTILLRFLGIISYFRFLYGCLKPLGKGCGFLSGFPPFSFTVYSN